MTAFSAGLSLLMLCTGLHAQQNTQPVAPPAQPQATEKTATAPAEARLGAQAATGTEKDGAAVTPEQLEQLVAPIALYPDTLLSQVLMASTYPLEIVEAARWLGKNPGLKGDKLDQALQQQTWDPSVKALCAVPDVVKRLNENLDWTQDLGDAFLAQREALMKTVQTMRQKAYEAGSLKSSKEMTVTEQADKIIVIETASPEVIYVPTYYPSAVYGGWGYPYYYYPPMYPPAPAGGLFLGFTVGVIWGSAWGNCNWGGNDIDIDINKQNNFVNRTENPARRDEVKNKAKQDGGNFKHDPAHRKGVAYKDSKVAQNYGASAGNNRVSRDQARGFSDRGAQGPSAGTRPATGGAGSAATRPSTGAGAGSGAAARPSTGAVGGSGASSRPSTRPSTGSLSGSRSPGFDSAASSRGGASRGSSGARSSSRGGGGGGRRR